MSCAATSSSLDLVSSLEPSTNIAPCVPKLGGKIVLRVIPKSVLGKEAFMINSSSHALASTHSVTDRCSWDCDHMADGEVGEAGLDLIPEGEIDNGGPTVWFCLLMLCHMGPSLEWSTVFGCSSTRADTCLRILEGHSQTRGYLLYNQQPLDRRQQCTRIVVQHSLVTV